jgi:hypothetical protein
LTVHFSEEKQFQLDGLAEFLAYTKVANPKLRAITIIQDLVRPDWADHKCGADYVKLGRQAGIDFRVLRRSAFQMRTTALSVKSGSNRAFAEARGLSDDEIKVYGTRGCCADLNIAISIASVHGAKQLEAVHSGVGVLKSEEEGWRIGHHGDDTSVDEVRAVAF